MSTAKYEEIAAKFSYLCYYFDTFILFLLIFGPKLPWRDLDILSIVCAISIVRHFRYLERLRYAGDFWITWICSGYMLLILVVYLNPDQWQAFKAIRMILNYAGVFAFSTYVRARYGRYGTAPILRMLHNALVLHALVVVMMAVFPPVRSVIEGVLVKPDIVMKSPWRISGLTRALGTPVIAMMFPFVSYLAFSLYSDYKERFIAVKLLLILAAVIHMGRSGFYLNIIAAFFVVLSAAFRGKQHIIHVGKIMLLSAICLGFLLNIALGNMDSILEKIPVVRDHILPVKHSMELFVNLWRDRGLYTRSTDHVLSQPIVYHNEGPLQIIFGTSLYGRGDPFTYLPTDVAYLHMFSAFGIIGVILFAAAYVMPLLQYSNMYRTPLYLIVVVSILMAFIANFKNTVLFTRHVYSLHVFLIAWLSYESWNTKTGSSQDDYQA